MIFIFLYRLITFIRILFHPKGGIGYLMNNSRSIASFGLNQSLSQLIPHLKTIIDVGSNIGQYALASHRFYPNVQIYCFEPVPACFQQLQKNTNKITSITSFNNALGHSNGQIAFFENKHTHASSALKVSDYQQSTVPKTKEFRETKVDSIRLDDFNFPTILERPLLLKLDVQGYEKNVLEGANAFLQKVDYILLETSFISMYKNEPSFETINVILKQQGFNLVAPIGDFSVHFGPIPQLDMLYKKAQQ
ncbi:FkbM family methyltransferase [Runella limosa]|uniref:FkbM family methyltransferase n=1 Tax=Runella limosa TaxID=370978 RepID=UPI00040F5FC2|nr:FkbM family methyltransferase [Runella limosa]